MQLQLILMTKRWDAVEGFLSTPLRVMNCIGLLSRHPRNHSSIKAGPLEGLKKSFLYRMRPVAWATRDEQREYD